MYSDDGTMNIFTIQHLSAGMLLTETSINSDHLPFLLVMLQGPQLLVCGSNGQHQLSLSHGDDTSTFQQVQYHPQLEGIINPQTEIIDLVSSSSHSLLLVNGPDGKNLLLGAGTNRFGQLGPRCALWDGVRPEGRFKVVNLLGDLGLDHLDWEPVKIAVTWSTSFVVYQKVNFSCSFKLEPAC
jgi:protein ATS1